MLPPKARWPTARIKTDCLHSAPPPNSRYSTEPPNWQITENMLYSFRRRSDLGVVSATLSSDVRGASLSRSAAAFFLPCGRLSSFLCRRFFHTAEKATSFPGKNHCQFDTVMKFYSLLDSNPDLTNFSHPFFWSKSNTGKCPVFCSAKNRRKQKTERTRVKTHSFGFKNRITQLSFRQHPFVSMNAKCF